MALLALIDDMALGWVLAGALQAAGTVLPDDAADGTLIQHFSRRALQGAGWGLTSPRGCQASGLLREQAQCPTV